jgi:drug/metabolite transporter (DMT)-like permease
MRHPAVAPALSLALLSVIWGYNWVAMKVGLGHAGPFTFASMRFVVAALCLLPVMMALGRSVAPTRQYWKPALILGFMLAANFAATLTALRLTGTGKTAVLVYTMPFWVLIFARITLHERLNRLQVIAVLFALAGLAWLIAPWNLHGGVLGSLLAVASGISWGASVVYVKHIQRRRHMSMMALSVWQMLIGAAILALGAGGVERGQPVDWTGEFVAALLFTSVLATGLGWLLFYYALRRMSAGMAGLGTLATPVIGVLAAWVHLGERPTAMEAVGMSLIAVGLWLLAWAGLRRATEL